MFVLITGATGGLGKSYTEECARRGYDLVLTGTNQTRVDAFAADIRLRYPNITVYAKACRLNEKAELSQFMSFVESLNEFPDFLINNAGYIVEGSVMGTSLEEICSCIDVNISGTMNLTYWFISKADSSRRNHILFVTSMAGFYPMPQMSAYASTKAFLTNMAVALRREQRKNNIYVSCVCPGSMATNDAMVRSIKSQGLGGRLSLQSTDKIARVSISNTLKNKAIWTPGFFNKALVVLSKFFPKRMISAVVGNRWEKCEKKRGEYR